MHGPDAGPILVVGPGALGVLFAARLHAAGHDVVVAARTAQAAQELGKGTFVAIDERGGRVEARPRVVHSPRQLEEVPRMTVLATKCAAAIPALATWLPALDDEAPVVCVQNGVMGDRLAPILETRQVECTVSIPATRESPGASQQTGPGALHIGPWPQARDRDDPKAYKAVARTLAAVAPVHASPNMRGVKWSKLLINSCITSLGVATGQDLGALLAAPKARAAFLAIVEEGYAAGRANGVRFETVSGFRPRLFAARWPGRQAILQVMGRRYRRQRSSSLQSLERGQKTEIDFLNGHIVATAGQHGLGAPVNDALIDIVHDIEASRRRPDPANLHHLPI